MVETIPLFDNPGVRLSPKVPKGLSRSRRRTALVLQTLDLNKHPMTGLPLHPDAPWDASKADRKPRPVTCATCVHLQHIDMGGYKTLDCNLATRNTGQRAWWPGCAQWKPTTGGSE
jgi:hypothetical protein